MKMSLHGMARREKFEELVAKERDLNNFMDSFPSRKAAKAEEQRAKQVGATTAHTYAVHWARR